jgi:hypothetical protein
VSIAGFAIDGKWLSHYKLRQRCQGGVQNTALTTSRITGIACSRIHGL